MILAGINLVITVDFLMVVPLGPHFALIGVPAEQIGILSGSYTAAAAAIGLVVSPFVDRFRRSKMLVATLSGLAIFTGAAGACWDLYSLSLARVGAGLFGGLSSAFVMALIADAVPAERRGRAMGFVASAFSIAAIAGVPLVIALSNAWSWRMTFLAVGVLCALLVPTIALLGRSSRTSGAAIQTLDSLAGLRSRRFCLAALVMFLSMSSLFLLAPIVPVYLVTELQYSLEALPYLYLVGGILSFAAMNAAGRMLDRFPTYWVTLVVTIALAAQVFDGFGREQPLQPVLLVFSGYMALTTARGVCVSTVLSKVPSEAQRGSFMAAVTSIEYASAALGAFVSAAILATGQGFASMTLVAIASIALAGGVPLIIWSIDRSAAGGVGLKT